MPAAPEVFRFQPVGTDAPTTAFMTAVGSNNVTVKSATVSGSNTIYVLDYKPTGTVETALSGGSVANPLRILAKPSAYLESYFENTKGMVEGVDGHVEAFARRGREQQHLLGVPVRGIGRRQHVGLLACLLYTSPSPRDRTRSRMPSSA